MSKQIEWEPVEVSGRRGLSSCLDVKSVGLVAYVRPDLSWDVWDRGRQLAHGNASTYDNANLEMAKQDARLAVVQLLKGALADLGESV